MKRYVRLSARAQLHEQVQHLRLDRHVERRHRLVADQELGLHRERAGDADARALAARELVRKAPHQRRVETDAVQLQADVFDLRVGADEAVRDRRLADDVDDAHPRIERRVRILEDHLHLELLARARRRRVQMRRAARRARSARLRTAAAARPRGGPSVDLPHPDSPTRPTTSPGAIARSTPSTACTTSSFRPAPSSIADLARRRRATCTKRFDTPRSSTSARHAGGGATGLRRCAHGRCSASSGWWQRTVCPRAGRRSAASPASSAQTVGRVRAALAKRAARRQVERRRRHAGNLLQPRAARAASTAPSRAAPACTDARGCASTSPTRALLDDAAGVHHADAIGETGDRPTGRA